VLAFGALTVAEAFHPGRVSLVVPVPKGNAVAIYRDPALSGALDAGMVVVLVFERRKDARQFDRLLAAERARSRLPTSTHAAPGAVQ